MCIYVPNIGRKAIKVGSFSIKRCKNVVSIVFFGTLDENNVVKPVLL